MQAREEVKGLLSLFLIFSCLAYRVQAGGELGRCMNAPQKTKSHLCCVLPLPPPSPPSGGECSGVKPHCTAHSAAPQVRAGHCSRGGQHLRVLQRGLNQPACFFSSHQSSLSPADSCLFPNKSYLGMMPSEAKAFPKASVLLRRREKWKGK